MSKAELRRKLESMKAEEEHSLWCNVKAFGGGPAMWVEMDRRNCTCSLGQRIRDLRAAIRAHRKGAMR